MQIISNCNRGAPISLLDAYSFMILNLETGEILCRISNTVNLFPTSWFDGTLLFLKKLKACVSDENVKLQVVDCCQRICFMLKKVVVYYKS